VLRGEGGARYVSPDLSTSLITAFDTPNWRAIADGFTPALIAARTRFALAVLKLRDAGLLFEEFEACASAACVGFGDLTAFFRRAASAVTPACSRANSSSLRIASELSKFDGNSTDVGVVRSVA
jgi:hypothetical protein